MQVRRNKISLFIVLSFLYSWFVLAVFLWMGGQWHTTAAYPVGILYMFGPAAAAVTAQKAFGDKLATPLGLVFSFNRWFIAAWLLPVFLALLAQGTALLLPGVQLTPDMSGLVHYLQQMLPEEQGQMVAEQLGQFPLHPGLIFLVQALIAGATINAVVALGEEVGWRGFMQHELRFLGFWHSSLIIGLVWGLWHAPLILQGHNYPQHPVAGVLMMTLVTVLLSPLFTYITIRSGSVLAAAVLHGTFNASAGLALLFISGGTDLTVGLTGLAGIFALVLLNAGLILYDRFLASESIT